MHCCLSLLFIAANKAVQLKESICFYWYLGGLIALTILSSSGSGGGRPDTHTDQIFFNFIGFLEHFKNIFGQGPPLRVNALPCAKSRIRHWACKNETIILAS